MAERKPYQKEIFVPFLQALVEKSSLSMRKISLACGQDHGFVRRVLNKGTRPGQDACIALAHYFNLHPNEVLEKAGYAPLAYFDLSLADPNEFSPDVKEVAQSLMKIENAETRRRVSEAVLRLVREMFIGESE